MLRSLFVLFPTLLLPWHGAAGASPACASTIPDLASLMGERALSEEWLETTMDDGRPLVMSIAEGDGVLMLGFTKTGEGLWAQSSGVVCKTETGLEAKFSRKQIRLGPAAGWLLRSVLKNGGKFTLTRLAPNQLRIATRGWSGDFSAVLE
jgi:hypothetical protein